ncbi:UNVERIFIED_CONTAM: hypothetical protein Slati_0863800 [Sesamum latifolium]|uniref:Endonuclease/exonuclease/phosphatase domain-containing protein n=1 Tax=Sesamum latifolium TaxID=2727402 RepID=A0AAW2XSH5_9LAMI
MRYRHYLTMMLDRKRKVPICAMAEAATVMSCLAWNCQGLRGPWTVRQLETMIQEHKPALIFLSETRCKSQSIDKCKRKWSMNGVNVDSRGKGGGLALLWIKEWKVSLQSFSNNHVDVHIEESDCNKKWRFTGVYGEPEVKNRKFFFWSLLKSLKAKSPLPWICMGDFNEIMFDHEKEGLRVPQWRMVAFRHTLRECGLTDMGYEGSTYTWTNNRISPFTVKERLDRAYVSTD